MRLVYPALHGRATRAPAGRFGGPERMGEPPSGSAVVHSTTAGGSHASWWSSLAHRHPPADHPAPVLLRLPELRKARRVHFRSRRTLAAWSCAKGRLSGRPFRIATRPLRPAAARGPGALP